LKWKGRELCTICTLLQKDLTNLKFWEQWTIYLEVTKWRQLGFMVPQWNIVFSRFSHVGLVGTATIPAFGNAYPFLFVFLVFFFCLLRRDDRVPFWMQSFLKAILYRLWCFLTSSTSSYSQTCQFEIFHPVESEASKWGFSLFFLICSYIYVEIPWNNFFSLGSVYYLGFLPLTTSPHGWNRRSRLKCVEMLISGHLSCRSREVFPFYEHIESEAVSWRLPRKRHLYWCNLSGPTETVGGHMWGQAP
jgi:hypothetical protein